jgi:hypothetical protein
MLQPAARQAHIAPGLHDCSLLSIGTLCDANYKVRFNKHNMLVCDNDKCIMTGHRDATSGLWHVDPPHPVQFANAIGDPTTAELVAFVHATLFSPALSTIESAIGKGYLTNFPGLTLRSLRQNPPRSIATTKGHMDQTRKNLRTTKPKNETNSDPTSPSPREAHAPEHDTSDWHPPGAASKTHECYVATFEPTGQIFTDQTGRFVTPSSNGNNYLMIMYDYDSNHIFAEPFPNRIAACILGAYKTMYARLCRAGLRPLLQCLDNECSEPLNRFMTDENIDYQLVPPIVHRRNAAKRAIRTFQNHFIAGLCSVDKAFPLHLWDRLIPQAEISLNLLRGSRINPKLSAWAQIHGTFDFNRTPLGPPGTRVLAHEKPDAHTTWSPHALDGWYVGPAMESYRCHQVWIWETRATRICDTLTWFPTHVPMPASSSTDIIMASLRDIIKALQNPSPRTPIAPQTARPTI